MSNLAATTSNTRSAEIRGRDTARTDLDTKNVIALLSTHRVVVGAIQGRRAPSPLRDGTHSATRASACNVAWTEGGEHVDAVIYIVDRACPHSPSCVIGGHRDIPSMECPLHLALLP